MPSASSAKVLPIPTQEKEREAKTKPLDLTDSFKQVVTLVEHKIRNMEKRKAKLDAYKLEQEQGKELNADQLAAVAKYGEVMQSLEFARDLTKNVTQIQLETSRLIKKQQKKDQADRMLAEAERTKLLLTFTKWINLCANVPVVRDDFENGRNGALTLTEQELEALKELSSIWSFEADMSSVDIGAATENFTNLIGGKSKLIPNTSMTYSHMKEILISMNDCGYVYDPNSKVQMNSIECQDTIESKEVNVSGNGDCAQGFAQAQDTPYHFMQKSQVDMLSPDIDPAIVAVSTSAPPQLFTQQIATMKQVIPQTVQNDSEPHAYRHGLVHANNFQGTQQSPAENHTSSSVNTTDATQNQGRKMQQQSFRKTHNGSGHGNGNGNRNGGRYKQEGSQDSAQRAWRPQPKSSSSNKQGSYNKYGGANVVVPMKANEFRKE